MPKTSEECQHSDRKRQHNPWDWPGIGRASFPLVRREGCASGGIAKIQKDWVKSTAIRITRYDVRPSDPMRGDRTWKNAPSITRMVW